MFKKNPQPYTELLGKTNRMVEATIIKGDIVSQADFRLDGELIGNFTSKGKIVIGPSGIIVGDIICKNADIEGKFEGNIQVDEMLNVKSTSIIKGDVVCGKLAVEPGADFTATCTMKQVHTNPKNNNGKPEEKKPE
ncbi:MAG TPA: polymer-forming cytoskeletal protein [Flavobacterium sp.]|jgi:cytoskeletal protein CcmA (bactofilin family)